MPGTCNAVSATLLQVPIPDVLSGAEVSKAIASVGRCTVLVVMPILRIMLSDCVPVQSRSTRCAHHPPAATAERQQSERWLDKEKSLAHRLGLRALAGSMKPTNNTRSHRDLEAPTLLRKLSCHQGLRNEAFMHQDAEASRLRVGFGIHMCTNCHLGLAEDLTSRTSESAEAQRGHCQSRSRSVCEHVRSLLSWAFELEVRGTP